MDTDSDALRIQEGDDGYELETVTFRDYFPRLAFKVLDSELRHTPFFLLADESHVEMMAVRDPRTGDIWWIDAKKWNRESSRHETELYRTVGFIRLKIQNTEIAVSNNSLTFTAAELEDCLLDFKGDLWNIILNESSQLTATVQAKAPLILEETLAQGVSDFVGALETLLRNPSSELRETQGKLPYKKVKPVARTFMELASKGKTSQLTSRVHVESPDTPENRFLHFALDRIRYLVRQIEYMLVQRRRRAEAKIARDLARLEQLAQPKVVDRIVFEQETSQMESQLQEIHRILSECTGDVPADSHSDSKYEIKLGKRYGDDRTFGQFFCDSLAVDGREIALPSRAEGHSTVSFPKMFQTDELTQILERQTLRLRGRASIEQSFRGESRRHTRISFATITEGRFRHPLKSALIEREQRRQQLTRNQWRSEHSTSERKDLAREGNTVRAQLEATREVLSLIESATIRVGDYLGRLSKVKTAMADSGIGRSSNFPSKMIFVQNPNYALAKSAFSKVLDNSGLDSSLFDSLQGIDEIGLVNVSRLYERWCLLKIISVLTDVYNFSLKGDWQNHLITAVAGSSVNVKFEMSSEALERVVTVTYEKQLASGKRPDFVIDIRNSFDDSEMRFVLDAKFKDGLADDTLSDLVQSLYQPYPGKNYSEDCRNRVFVIHPTPNPIEQRSSPLDWGGHSDYGQLRRHRYGAVYLSPSFTNGNSVDNLQRLIGLMLDGTTVHEDLGPSGGDRLHAPFCLPCGESSIERVSVDWSRTDGGNKKWQVSCGSCGHRQINNLCAGCGTRLVKHGLHWTYHKTRAEEPFNIVCPVCQHYL